MHLNYDYIVVGSGATGAMAAQTLVEAGVSVAVLDVGEKDETFQQLIPDKDLISIRKEEQEQHKYFLGNNFEGIPWSTNRVGSQLTPPRNFLTRFTEKYIPFTSETFAPMESLARGGLGGGWGVGCYVFSDAELNAIGLDNNEMKVAYEKVSERIGISGENDDASPYVLNGLNNAMPSTNLENNLSNVFERYKRKKSILNKNGMFLGRSALAVLTQDKGSRKKNSYRDMDFWSDKEKSAYRSWMTMDELSSKNNFSYHDKCLVVKFEEDAEGVQVHVLRTDSNETQIFRAKKLILASGVLGTARIVLRSSNKRENKLPIICNPYCYIPCIQTSLLGSETEQMKTSFGQLVIAMDEKRDNFDVGLAALFSYRSLLLFKLIKETPLNYADGRIIMQYLQSAITIAGIHHPERSGKEKFIQLKNSSTITGDILTGQYILTSDEESKNVSRENKFKWALKKLGCRPLRTIHTPHGGSIHYAGTLPFDETGKQFTINKNGKLSGTKNIYVADGSGFQYLPAKGLTLTLMANAHLVALQSIKNE